MRIAGVTIPPEKRLIISLQYIYGVGPVRAQEICNKTNINKSIRVKDLTMDQEKLIRDILASFEFTLEADLRREISQNVKRLQDISSYRGYRHRRRLPARGQKTKTNARTRRGRKGAAIAKKKVVSK